MKKKFLFPAALIFSAAVTAPVHAGVNEDLMVAVDSYCQSKNAKEFNKINPLLKKGANPHTPNSQEMTPLEIAIYHHCPEGAKALLVNKVNVNALGSTQVPPLIAALQSYKDAAADRALVDVLLQAGADVNQMDPNQIEFPLMLATGMRSEISWPNLVSKLLAAGANAKQKTPNNYSPLNAGSPDLESLKALLQAGADASLASKIDGLTPLHKVCDRNSSNTKDRPDPKAAERIKLLMEHGGNINAVRTDTAESVLMQNIKYGNPECVEALFKAGANPKLKTIEGKTVKDEMNTKYNGLYSPKVIAVLKRYVK
ncbi:MAG: ankyrin repeat domain-containing protein [Proteobacteria bacterium]|nr:ankyrin repeat domain-containing protein [Pseudomonadota bacterium]